MNKPQEIDSIFTKAVLALEEAIFEFEDLLQKSSSLKKKDFEDIVTAKELAESSRNLAVCVIASFNGKKKPLISV